MKIPWRPNNPVAALAVKSTSRGPAPPLIARDLPTLTAPVGRNVVAAEPGETSAKTSAVEEKKSLRFMLEIFVEYGIYRWFAGRLHFNEHILIKMLLKGDTERFCISGGAEAPRERTFGGANPILKGCLYMSVGYGFHFEQNSKALSEAVQTREFLREVKNG